MFKQWCDDINVATLSFLYFTEASNSIGVRWRRSIQIQYRVFPFSEI